MKKLKYHPLANIFPMFGDEQLETLAAQIKARGQRHKIVLLDGMILDGRNRYEACLRADIEPRFMDYKGDDPLAFVLEENFYRRDLTTSQRAMIAGELATGKHGDWNRVKGEKLPAKSSQVAEMQLGESTSVTQAKAAETLGVSPRSVAAAVKIINNADEETIAEVKSGEKSVTAAAAEIKPEPKKPEPAKSKGGSKSADRGPSAAYTKALDRIGIICGAKVKKGITEEVLKVSPAEVLYWAKLDDPGMADIQELVVASRWSPSKAHAFRKKMVGPKTKVEELFSHCVAEGGEWEGTVTGYAITVRRVKK